jgi:hypothetical protein
VPPDPKRSRFLYGILFAWAPSLPFFVNVARDIVPNKATGLGAVVGGLSDWGLIAIIPLGSIAALILLARSFARGHWLRSMVAVVSMLWSSTVLCLLALLIWVLHTHR